MQKLLEAAKSGTVVWIRGPTLRQRWGGMSNGTFYEKLRKGLIPAPEYPFGEGTPYWRVTVIEQFEDARRPQ